MTDVPEYPFWQASELEAAFGADRSKYAQLTKEQASAVARELRSEEGVFSALFFSGGKLADHGLRWKSDLAADAKPYLTLRALMSSFDPSHEVKSATVALALYHWCEKIPAHETATA